MHYKHDIAWNAFFARVNVDAGASSLDPTQTALPLYEQVRTTNVDVALNYQWFRRLQKEQNFEQTFGEAQTDGLRSN